VGLGKLFKSFLGTGGSSGSRSGGTGTSGGKAADPIEYKGFTIVAEPVNEGGQFRTAGKILKTVDGETRETRFIRADNNGDFQSAVDHCHYKARQIIDEQGDALLGREMV